MWAGALVFGYFTSKCHSSFSSTHFSRCRLPTPLLIREEINPLVEELDPVEPEKVNLHSPSKEDRAPDQWKH
jgi:hypothetical protein